MQGLAEDTQVHCLGTGTMGYHTDTIRLSINGYPQPGMADIWTALAAHKHRVPMIAIARTEAFLKEIPLNGPSIWNETRKDDRAHVSLINSVDNWDDVPDAKTLSVLYTNS